MKIQLTQYAEQTEMDFDSRSDTTETQRVNKWRAETKDTIRFDVKKGTKSYLMNEASKRGMSLTQMIKESLKQYLS